MKCLFAKSDPSPVTPFAEPTYRIPALAVLPSGRMVVACDVRADWKDLPGDFDVVARFSDDGQEWSEQVVVKAHGERGYGDPSLLFDPVTQILWCLYVSAGAKGFFTGDLRIEASTSVDGGETWTARGPLDVEIDADSSFTSSGNGVALSSGRLVQPLVLRKNDGLFASMLLSDDHGETWRCGTPVGPDCDENKVVELADGSLLMHARSKPRRRQARSVDGGETWSVAVPHEQLVDPACNGGLTRVGDVLVATGLRHEEDRRDLGVRVSVDGGETWSAGVPVRLDAAGYSCVQARDDGVVVVWEDGDYEAIYFVTLSLDECLTGGPVRSGGRAFASGVAANPDRDV